MFYLLTEILSQMFIKGDGVDVNKVSVLFPKNMMKFLQDIDSIIGRTPESLRKMAWLIRKNAQKRIFDRIHVRFVKLFCYVLSNTFCANRSLSIKHEVITWDA